MAIRQSVKPRRFQFFYQGSMADPAHLVPVVEILPKHQQVYFLDWRARLAMWVVKILLPNRDECAVPMTTVPYGEKARIEYMYRVAEGIVNRGGPRILSVHGPGAVAADHYFGITVPVEHLGQEYGQAMLRLAYEAVRARLDEYE